MQQEMTHEQELLAFVDLNAPEGDQVLAERLFSGWEYIRTDSTSASDLLVTMYCDGYFSQRRIDLAAAGAN